MKILKENEEKKVFRFLCTHHVCVCVSVRPQVFVMMHECVSAYRAVSNGSKTIALKI